jgi:hypothetical protein
VYTRGLQQKRPKKLFFSKESILSRLPRFYERFVIFVNQIGGFKIQNARQLSSKIPSNSFSE